MQIFYSEVKSFTKMEINLVGFKILANDIQFAKVFPTTIFHNTICNFALSLTIYHSQYSLHKHLIPCNGTGITINSDLLHKYKLSSLVS